MGTHADVDLYLEGVANFVVCTIGMGINAAAIGILCRQKTSSLFVKLMISLVSYDLIYVFLFATCYSLPRLSHPFKGRMIFLYIGTYLLTYIVVHYKSDLVCHCTLLLLELSNSEFIALFEMQKVGT